MHSSNVKSKPQVLSKTFDHLRTCSVHQNKEVLFIYIDPVSKTGEQTNTVCLKCETCLLEGDLEESYLLSISQVLGEFPSGILEELDFFRIKMLMDKQNKGEELNMAQKESINEYCRNFIKDKSFAIEKCKNELIEKIQMIMRDIDTSICILATIQEFKKSQEIKNNAMNKQFVWKEQHQHKSMEDIRKTLDDFGKREILYNKILNDLTLGVNKESQGRPSNGEEDVINTLEKDFSLRSDQLEDTNFFEEFSQKMILQLNNFQLFQKGKQKIIANNDIQKQQSKFNFLNNMEASQLNSIQSQLLDLLASQSKFLNQIVTKQEAQGNVVDAILQDFTGNLSGSMDKLVDLNEFFQQKDAFNEEDETLDTFAGDSKEFTDQLFEWKIILGSSKSIQISQTDSGSHFICSKHTTGIIRSNLLTSEKQYSFRCIFKKPLEGHKGISIGLYDDRLNPPNIRENNFDSLIGKGARRILLGDYLNGEILNKKLTVIVFRICLEKKQFYIFDESMDNITQGTKEKINISKNIRIGVFLDDIQEDLEFEIEWNGY